MVFHIIFTRNEHLDNTEDLGYAWISTVSCAIQSKPWDLRGNREKTVARRLRKDNWTNQIIWIIHRLKQTIRRDYKEQFTGIGSEIRSCNKESE